MPILCRDVLELILKRLPIETRVPLRVRPNRAVPSDAVVKTVARMARIVAHPNHLCWVLTRVVGYDEPIKVMSYSAMSTDIFTGVQTLRYHYIMPCRTMRLQAVGNAFSPFLCETFDKGTMFDWHMEVVKQLEDLGDVC